MKSVRTIKTISLKYKSERIEFGYDSGNLFLNGIVMPRFPAETWSESTFIHLQHLQETLPPILSEFLIERINFDGLTARQRKYMDVNVEYIATSILWYLFVEDPFLLNDTCFEFIKTANNNFILIVDRPKKKCGHYVVENKWELKIKNAHSLLRDLLH